MTRRALVLTLAGWEFACAKKMGMVKIVMYREPVRLDGRYRDIITQSDAWAWHQQNRRNKLAVYVPDLRWARARKDWQRWRVQGADSTVALMQQEPAAVADCPKVGR